MSLRGGESRHIGNTIPLHKAEIGIYCGRQIHHIARCRGLEALHGKVIGIVRGHSGIHEICDTDGNAACVGEIKASSHTLPVNRNS